MRRGIAAALLCGLAGVGATTLHAGGPAGEPQPWWRDPTVQRQVKLTALQVERLDAIFNRDLPARRKVNRRILQLDDEVRRAFLEEDDGLLQRASAELESLHRQRNTRRWLMLVKMYRTLTPEQRTTLSGLRSAERVRP